MDWYELTIRELREAGVTFEDNPFWRVVEVMNSRGVYDWRDRADMLWCARQEWERFRSGRLARRDSR
jgi:hypothetical protein